jgi:hypothetical protein
MQQRKSTLPPTGSELFNARQVLDALNMSYSRYVSSRQSEIVDLHRTSCDWRLPLVTV